MPPPEIGPQRRGFAVIQLPEIGTYADIAACLKLSRKTVYKLVCLREFKKGIYLGRGRFNIERLKICIERDGTYLNERNAGIKL